MEGLTQVCVHVGGPGNDGLCGLAPNGVSVFKKAGSADPEQIYTLGKSCAIEQAAAASAGGSSVSMRLQAALVGSIVGGAGVIAVIVVSIWYVLRQARRRRSAAAAVADREAWGQGTPQKSYSIDDKVMLTASSHVLLRCS